MSAIRNTVPDAPVPPTQPDADAVFASVVWVHSERAAGRLKQYEGMRIAVLGRQVIDADRDADELGRRVAALGGTIPQEQVVVQYIPRPEDWDWK
jgi:hypothetical protein